MRKRRYLTVRNVPGDIADELERERKRRGASFNQTVVNALRRGLGLIPGRKSNGLAALAGRWTPEDFEAFERTVADVGEQVDEEVWR